MVLIKQLTLITFSLLLITACSSAPRHVNASLPLVSEAIPVTGKLIPEEYWQTLNEVSPSAPIAHKQYQINLQAIYHSALGETCRSLDFYEKGVKVQTRIACAQTQQAESDQQKWYLVHDIIKNATVVSM